MTRAVALSPVTPARARDLLACARATQDRWRNVLSRPMRVYDPRELLWLIEHHPEPERFARSGADIRERSLRPRADCDGVVVEVDTVIALLGPFAGEGAQKARGHDATMAAEPTA